LISTVWIAGRHTGFSAAGWLYIASVSIYSAALVFYPAQSGRPGLAAMIYAVAGWGGSALGIGLVEGRVDLPMEWVVGAGGVMAAGFFWRVVAARFIATA
jgi:cytochrome c oxidase cbb3-type subunit 2